MKKDRKTDAPLPARSGQTKVLRDRSQQPLVLKKVRLVVMKGKDEGRDETFQQAAPVTGGCAASAPWRAARVGV